MISLWCRGSYTQQEGEGLPDFKTDCLLCLLNITGTNWSENRMCSWFSTFNPPDMSLSSSCPVYHVFYLVPFTVCFIYPGLTLLLQPLRTDWSEFLTQWHPWVLPEEESHPETKIWSNLMKSRGTALLSHFLNTDRYLPPAHWLQPREVTS